MSSTQQVLTYRSGRSLVALELPALPVPRPGSRQTDWVNCWWRDAI